MNDVKACHILRHIVVHTFSPNQRMASTVSANKNHLYGFFFTQNRPDMKVYGSLINDSFKCIFYFLVFLKITVSCPCDLFQHLTFYCESMLKFI